MTFDIGNDLIYFYFVIDASPTGYLIVNYKFGKHS